MWVYKQVDEDVYISPVSVFRDFMFLMMIKSKINKAEAS